MGTARHILPGRSSARRVHADPKQENRRTLSESGGLSKKQKLKQVGCELGNHCARCDHRNIYRFRTDIAQRLGITHAVEHDNLRALMSEFSCGFLEFFFRSRVRRGSCKDGRLIESFPFIEFALGCSMSGTITPTCSGLRSAAKTGGSSLSGSMRRTFSVVSPSNSPVQSSTIGLQPAFRADGSFPAEPCGQQTFLRRLRYRQACVR